MQIEKNKVVSITYKLSEAGNAGEVIQEVDANQPLVFLFGMGQLLPKFEEHLAGKSKGDAYEFTLAHTDAYGAIETEAVVDIPIDVFLVDGKLAEDMLVVGGMVRLRDQEGRLLQGTFRAPLPTYAKPLPKRSSTATYTEKAATTIRRHIQPGFVIFEKSNSHRP